MILDSQKIVHRTRPEIGSQPPLCDGSTNQHFSTIQYNPDENNLLKDTSGFPGIKQMV